ncbi:MAG: 3'-5' exonuclease [Planctomycetota bacterium]
MLIFFDLEATCWKNNRARQSAESEIIEIGAIKEDGQTFRSFVRPVINPVLTGFCTELTGITQADVDGADDFGVAGRKFMWFCGQGKLVSWGAYDSRQLRKDCGRHKIKWQFDHLNLKNEYSKLMGVTTDLLKATRHAELEFAGAHHRALDDAKAVFNIYRYVLKNKMRKD